MDTLIRVGPDNAVVGTVNVAVRFALLDEEPETMLAVSKHHFVIINPYFPIFSVCGSTKTCAKQDCI
jgi:hypothetical protein